MLEVADIFREAGPAYKESFASRMPRSHLRAMRAIESCRTAALGGHVLACDQCPEKQYTYHSCRNRHCPKCQGQEGQHWLSPKSPRFLVPGYALSILFRAKVRDALKKAQLFADVPAAAWARNKKWVVHVQHAGTGTKVLAYLARYVFRIAITNSRLVRFENGQVTFQYRDNRSGAIKYCTVPSGEFIRLFLQHVLPRGFTKVRHYGVYSPTRRADLDRARSLIGSPRHEPEPITPEPTDDSTPITAASTPAERSCPSCKVGHLRIIETIPRMSSRGPP